MTEAALNTLDRSTPSPVSRVGQDYARHWEGAEPPSLADVVEFCAAARIVVTARDEALEAHLVELGLLLQVAAT